jgi:hypothetical protein
MAEQQGYLVLPLTGKCIGSSPDPRPTVLYQVSFSDISRSKLLWFASISHRVRAMSNDPKIYV